MDLFNSIIHVFNGGCPYWFMFLMGTWAMVAIGGDALALGIGAGALMSGGGDEKQKQLPPFQSDPYVGKTQDELFPFYSSIMKGNIPDYYAPIGQWGGPEYQKMMALTNRDVTNATNENLVRRGISRGGLGADIVGRAVGDASTKFTWADYNRAMQGRQWLGTWGTTGMEGVRNAALTNQSQINNYALNAGEFQMNYDASQQAASDKQWADLLSAGVGSLGNIYGMNMLSDAMKAKNAVAPSSMFSPGYTLGGIDITEKNYGSYKPEPQKWLND